MRVILYISFAFVLMTTALQAHIKDSTVQVKKIRLYKKPFPPARGDVFIIAMPIVAYNPTNGFMFGGGTSTSAFFGDPASTSISSGLASIMYTTKKQLLFYLKTTLFNEDNRLIFSGDWRYMDTSLPTYGVGTGP
jgi:hypothetical protein